MQVINYHCFIYSGFIGQVSQRREWLRGNYSNCQGKLKQVLNFLVIFGQTINYLAEDFLHIMYGFQISVPD